MGGERTFVIGVGMTKFDKPGTKEGDYPDWAREAGEKALADAGIYYDHIEQAFAGSTVEIRVPASLTCEACHGTGCKPGTSPLACTSCGGAGRWRSSAFRPPCRPAR